MQYIIIGAILASHLEEVVNQMIKKGWEPLGGVDSNVLDGAVEYLQAMVRRDK